MKYTDVWNNLTRQMGYWVNMDAPYVPTKTNTLNQFGGCLVNFTLKDSSIKDTPFSRMTYMAGTGLKLYRIKSTWDI